MPELKGLRALVTGSTQGIGLAVARRLREAGATVLGTARTQTADSPEFFVAADVTSPQGCASVAAAVAQQLGGIDIVVHVVGGSSAPGGGFVKLDDQEWHKAFDLNLFPAVRLDRALLPAMLAQGSGVIIYVTSIQDRMPVPEATLAYASAKAACPTTAKASPKKSAPRA